MQPTPTAKKRPVKMQVISPDGFTIDFVQPHYRSRKKAIEAFNAWKKRYEIQGYYSSSQYGRIPIEDLEDYCQFIDLNNY